MRLTIKADSPSKRISLWNGIFNLTKKELEVLSQLITAEEKTSTGNHASKENKKLAATALSIKDYNTLNNYIKKLKDKKALTLTNNCYKLHPLLNTSTTDVHINIKHV